MCSSTVAVYSHTVKMRSRQMYSPTLLPGIVSFVQFVLSSNRPNHFILQLDCAISIGYWILSKTHFQTVLLGSVSCCIHLQSPYLSHDRATHNYSSWINKRVLIVIPQKSNTRTIVETGTKTVTSFLPSSAQVLLINRPWKLECHVLVRLLIRLSERPWKLKLQALVKCIMLKMFTKEASMSANIGSCILYEVPQQLIKPLDLNMVLSPNHFYICGTNSV